jgi:PDZ domain-containing protein
VHRRSLTLLLAGLLAVLLTAGASAARVPYVAYLPGPTFDTLGEVDGTPVIDVQGREVFPTDGRLDLTTVSLRSRLTLSQAVVAGSAATRRWCRASWSSPRATATRRSGSATPSA